MATKKKLANAAKKSIPAKKVAPAKKAAAKPAHSSGSKATKKAPLSKSAAKPVAKKVAPAKKPTPMPAKKPVASKSVTPKSVIAKSAPSKSVASKSVPPKPAPPAAKFAQATAKPIVRPVPHTPPAAAAKNAIPAKAVVSTAKPIIPTSMTAKPEPKKIVTPPKPVKVVIPEMKTKTVRKYEPEFTKSVLDTPHEVQTGPTMRYSDSELGEFRELINRKLDAAKKELAYLQGLITRKDEMGGDNDDARYMTMEDGSMSMEREQLSQMASRQITFIDHLEKAIMRIENKTYGICRVTGKLIDKARLRAVPHATLSIEAKQMMNK
jgi:RNA polymerase-binding transcription factor DksA